MATWREHHPTWEYTLWGDHDLGWLHNRPLFDYAHRYVPADAVWQFKADIARYEILSKWGGFYADADTQCLAPIDDAVEGRTTFAAAEDDNWVGNTYLGCTRGNPVMRALMDRLPGSARRLKGRRPNKISGPQYLTPIWNSHGCHVDPTDLWYPYSYSDVKQGTVPTNHGDAYAIHTWNHTREVLERRKR